jgi:hypothetical protein
VGGGLQNLQGQRGQQGQCFYKRKIKTCKARRIFLRFCATQGQQGQQGQEFIVEKELNN